MDPDQLASEKPADQDLHCFHNIKFLGSAWKMLSYFKNTILITSLLPQVVALSMLGNSAILYIVC